MTLLRMHCKGHHTERCIKLLTTDTSTSDREALLEESLAYLEGRYGSMRRGGVWVNIFEGTADTAPCGHLNL